MQLLWNHFTSSTIANFNERMKPYHFFCISTFYAFLSFLFLIENGNIWISVHFRTFNTSIRLFLFSYFIASFSYRYSVHFLWNIYFSMRLNHALESSPSWFGVGFHYSTSKWLLIIYNHGNGISHLQIFSRYGRCSWNFVHVLSGRWLRVEFTHEIFSPLHQRHLIYIEIVFVFSMSM